MMSGEVSARVRYSCSRACNCYDREGRRKYVNQAYERVVGTARDQALGEVPEENWQADLPVEEYRRRIEQELRALSFSEVEEARRFEGALRDRVRELVLVGEQNEVAV